MAVQVVEDIAHISTGELILQAATHSFAQLGYHGASIRAIARQAGVSIATLYYYAHNKDDLYRQVFQRQFEEEQALIARVFDSSDHSLATDPLALRSALFRLADALIERSASNPDIVRLWTLRWLDQPAHTFDFEAAYSLPLYEHVRRLLEQAKEQAAIHPLSDIDTIIHAFTWLNYGRFGFGQLTFPGNAASVEDFRAFVHAFMDAMLGFTAGAA